MPIKKWFKLITNKYNDYNHAIFFGSLVPEWNWDTLMPWIEIVAYTRDSLGTQVKVSKYRIRSKNGYKS